MVERPAWMLDEQQSAGRENLDALHVLQYDAKEDASAAHEVSLLLALGLDQDAAVVDPGAGTGQLTLAIAPACARITAADVSPVMVDLLSSKVAQFGLQNIKVVQAGFLSYEHRGRPADLVYSRYALHHLPDFWKVLALQRIRGILRPGGIFRLWDIVYRFGPEEASERLDAWCATLSPDVTEGWTRADIEEHIRDEHSTFTWLLEPIIERCGFRIEVAEHSEDGIFARYIARAI